MTDEMERDVKGVVWLVIASDDYEELRVVKVFAHEAHARWWVDAALRYGRAIDPAADLDDTQYTVKEMTVEVELRGPTGLRRTLQVTCEACGSAPHAEDCPHK